MFRLFIVLGRKFRKYWVLSFKLLSVVLLMLCGWVMLYLMLLMVLG